MRKVGYNPTFANLIQSLRRSNPYLAPALPRERLRIDTVARRRRMPSMTSFDAILSVAARELPRAGVDCLLIGGFAVNYYGYRVLDRA